LQLKPFLTTPAITRLQKEKKMNTQITPALVAKAKEALLETQRLIDKEMRYSEDLRHKDKIAKYEIHIVKLKGIIQCAA
jgi:hypothetical protein